MTRYHDKPVATIALFVVAMMICQSIGLLGSLATIPNLPTWYAGLVKPTFTPPAWVFAPVWTILYLMMGMALALVWRLDHPLRKTALLWFWIQLALNAMWSPLFFGLHSPLLGLIDIILLWIAIGLTQKVFWQVSRPAFGLMLPYWLWVSYALVLNFEIWRLNSPMG